MTTYTAPWVTQCVRGRVRLGARPSTHALPAFGAQSASVVRAVLYPNIAVALLFVSAASGDFHVRPDSPCLDAGSGGWVSVNPHLAGNQRIIGMNMDMGGCELGPSAP